ncbi:MAG: tripartite tricarboxylate transporter permease [Haloferacaceae archaeon]
MAYVLAGVALGSVSGLTPGVHANNFALLLAAVAPGLPGPPVAVGSAMLAAGTVHTFLDVVPTLALGVPDASLAASALPGHRLVLAGRGREALRLSALGSGLATVLALALAIPVTRVAVAVYPAVRAYLPLVLAGVVLLLLATEPSRRAAVAGAVAFALSAGLGVLTLDAPTGGVLPAGGTLAPLFAGLFGAPVLLDAMDGAGVPPQGSPAVTMPRFDLGVTALAGTIAGALVGYLPGVSAGVASVLALPAVPGRSGARGYVVATSGANTATALFALVALVALGSPRTGVLVALEATAVPLALPVLLAATVAAAALGFALVLVVGDRYLAAAGRVDQRRLSLGVLALLVLLSLLFAGAVGLAVFAAATLVGLVPVRLRTRRVHLMGVLIGPLALGG